MSWELILPEDDYRYYRENITLLEDRGVQNFPDGYRNPAILSAIGNVPRHLFVNESYKALGVHRQCAADLPRPADLGPFGDRSDDLPDRRIERREAFGDRDRNRVPGRRSCRDGGEGFHHRDRWLSGANR